MDLKNAICSFIPSLKGNFSKQTLYTYVSKLFLLFSGLLISPLLARSLGPALRGQYAIFINFAELMVQLLCVGVPAANVFFVSQNKENANKVFGNSIFLSFCVGLLVAVLLLSGFGFFKEIIESSNVLKLTLSLYVMLDVFYILALNILYGFRDVYSVNKGELLSKIFYTTSFFLLYFTDTITILTVFQLLIISNILLSSFLFYKISKVHSCSPELSFSFFKRSIPYTYKAFLACLFSFLLFRVDIFMVRYFLSDADTGYYAISLLMLNLLQVLPITVGGVFFPRVSAEKVKNEKWKMIKKVSFYLFILVFVMAFLAFTLVRPLVEFLFGAEYHNSISPFYYLLPGVVCLAPSIIFQNGMASLSRNHLIMVPPLLGLCCNFIFNYILIQSFGLVGTGIATSISYFIFMLSAFVLCRVQFSSEKWF